MNLLWEQGKGFSQKWEKVSGERKREGIRNRLENRMCQTYKSISGLPHPASGMERMLCTKNTRGRVGWAFWHRTEGVEYR